MNGLLRVLIVCFAASAVQAQPHWSSASAIVPSATALPPRNLQIEVRQIEHSTGTDENLDATVTLESRPGQSRIGLGINARQDQAERSHNIEQQVLVLNGRRAAIVLRNSSPLRLRQMTRHQGVWISGPGLVWIDQDTGFDAQARWNGGDTVELELTAMQGRNSPGSGSAATSTFILASLGEWITVAHSEQDSSSRQNPLMGSDNRAEQRQLRIQLRVNLR